MPSFTPAKALLVALLAAFGLAAQAQAPAKKGGDDTSQQIAAGIELEMTAMMACLSTDYDNHATAHRLNMPEWRCKPASLLILA